MATEFHNSQGRTGRVASVPEAPGICHVTSLHVEHHMLHRYHKNIYIILVEQFSHAFGKAFCDIIREMKIQLYELHFAFLLDIAH
jgi:hypothetical protein